MDVRTFGAVDCKHPPPPRQAAQQRSHRLAKEIEAGLRSLGGAATIEELTRHSLGTAASDGAFRQRQAWVRSELQAAYWRGEIQRENIGDRTLRWRYRLPMPFTSTPLDPSESWLPCCVRPDA